MANRYFTQFVNSLAKQPVKLFGRVTFGASGAPTLDATNSKGIKSITRVSAGKYTIVLGGGGPSGTATDIYPRLFGFKHTFLNASAPASPSAYLFSEAVAASGSFVVIFNAAGTATDPGSGEEVRFEVMLSNSTAP